MGVWGLRPRRSPGAEPLAFRFLVDCRALQDANYATKGIGEHTLFMVSLLGAISSVLPIADRLLPLPRQDAAPLFDGHLLMGLPRDLQDEDVYVNPSPLTHDTSLFVGARRRGLRTAAVVHDFIPFRQPALRADREAFAAYQYLVHSLAKYDLLIANSDFTAAEIGRFLPEYSGTVVTVHCRSRFAAEGDSVSSEAGLDLCRGGPYVFVAAADDPRKNVAAAIKMGGRLRSMGLRLVIGGGLGAATRRQLMSTDAAEFCVADPIFLPRLTDDELRGVYAGARVVLVCSQDEGFSLPVAEAIALRRPVAASNIPAHKEQILDKALLFAPHDAARLVNSVAYALAHEEDAAWLGIAYRRFDYLEEAASLRSAVGLLDYGTALRPHDGRAELTIVGPDFDKASGIAVYNRSIVQECRVQNRAVTYVDPDAFETEYFYEWLLAHQERDILYVMGNNNTHHTKCFVAMQNVPGACIMHDSRLFEFLLNRDGPYRVAELWNLLHPGCAPVDVETVTEWQLERRRLPYSFLDPLVARCRAIIVHSRILADHIRSVYGYENVTCLAFALQMTRREIGQVTQLRRGRRRAQGDPVHLVMLGETDPMKACCEIVFAVRLLRIIGLDAMLSFVGKSDEPYRTELAENARRLGIEEHVRFVSYVSREVYLDYMGSADVLVQLRYAMFGQVSGPVGDAVACGVPMVTTQELAAGSGLEEHCTVVPNQFSPLHIAEAVRRLLADDPAMQAPARINQMADYVNGLFEALAQVAAS